MKKILLALIAILIFTMAGCAITPLPVVFAEVTQVEVVNPVTINPPPVPVPPGDILVSGITDTAATVSWSPVATATQYSVWVNGSRWTGADSPGVVLQGLQPYTIYDVYVTAANESGESGPSPTASFTTLPPVPAAPPTPTVTSVTGNSALVQWEPLPAWQYIQAYRVYVDGTAVADVTPQEGMQAANLTNLPAGSHIVSVAGINANREGPPSTPVQFTTQAVASPTGLKMANHSADTIWLRWDAVPGADHYVVNANGQAAGETTQANYVLSGLQAGSVYQVGVIAVTPDGNRSQEASIQVETLPAAAPVTKEAFIQDIFAYVPDIVPGVIAIFAVGAAFALARAAKQPFVRSVFLRLWR